MSRSVLVYERACALPSAYLAVSATSEAPPQRVEHIFFIDLFLPIVVAEPPRCGSTGFCFLEHPQQASPVRLT
jgi:hypothetical protein